MKWDIEQEKRTDKMRERERNQSVRIIRHSIGYGEFKKRMQIARSHKMMSNRQSTYQFRFESHAIRIPNKFDKK